MKYYSGVISLVPAGGYGTLYIVVCVDKCSYANYDNSDTDIYVIFYCYNNSLLY